MICQKIFVIFILSGAYAEFICQSFAILLLLLLQRNKHFDICFFPKVSIPSTPVTWGTENLMQFMWSHPKVVSVTTDVYIGNYRHVCR